MSGAAGSTGASSPGSGPPIAARATAGFGAAAQAERYDRARPSYPSAALAVLAQGLGIGPGRRVLDLAAGTGKLTAQLAGLGAEVVAVEPLEAMRAVLAKRLPAVEVRDGAAEAIPLPDASVDAVTVGQAFHWFDVPRALGEVARVLRPGGGLAMLWNDEDERVPWVAAMNHLMHDSQALPFDPDQDWSLVLGADARFGDVRATRYEFGQAVTVDLLLELVASTSYIAAMAEADRAAQLAQVRELVAGFDEPFDLPYVGVVHWCRRSSSTPS